MVNFPKKSKFSLKDQIFSNLPKETKGEVLKIPKKDQRPNEKSSDQRDLQTTNLVANDQIWQQFLQEQNGFQRGLETAPLLQFIKPV